MNDCAIPAKEIYSILKEKEVPYLYHANTVASSLTFIQNRALLSRGFVERKGLFQTPQKSDTGDKEFDVWEHIFFDGADLHLKYKRCNHYGPVLSN